MSFKCALASNGIAFDTDGSLTPCCQYTSRKSSLPSLHYTQLDDFDKQVRQPLLNDLNNGILHSGCVICWQQEKISGSSLRTAINDIYKEVPETEDIIDIELRMGNTCNLKCTMCGPYASSLWYAEQAKYRDSFMSNNFYKLEDVKNPTTGWYEPDKKYYTSKWHENKDVLDFVKKNLLSLRKINFGGGEPFMSKSTLPIIQLLAEEQNLHPDFTLQINTNATIFDQEHIEMLGKLQRRIRLIVSLEGIEKHNDYLRYPSDWQSVDVNIRAMCQLRDECRKLHREFDVHCQHTVQPGSVYSFKPLAEYCHKKV